MNNSRPAGSLDGGGWGPSPATGPTPGFSNAKDKKDKVLASMFEMFLDSMDPDIIESVVHSCKFNHSKSMETLLAMCGNDTSSKPSVFNTVSTIKSSYDNPRTLSAVQSTAVHDQRKTARGQDVRYRNSTVSPTLQQLSQTGPNPTVNATSRMVSAPAAASSRTSFFPSDAQPTEENDLSMEKIWWYVENGQKIMILMRGCPGSGKSHLAREIIEKYGGNPKDFIFSTDDFFVKNNRYNFQRSQLSEAHEWNQKRVRSQMKDGISPIIIDNTNTQLWEMNIYASFAISNGYAIEMLEPRTPWFKRADELFKHNQHGVPRDTIKMMLERYEYNLTVEELIRSTGAKYSRSPPQPADNPLRVFQPRNSIQESLKTSLIKERSESAVAKASNNLFNHSTLTNSKGAHDLNSCTESHSSSSQIDFSSKSNEVPDSEGFYFGSCFRNECVDTYQPISIGGHLLGMDHTAEQIISDDCSNSKELKEELDSCEKSLEECANYSPTASKNTDLVVKNDTLDYLESKLRKCGSYHSDASETILPSSFSLLDTNVEEVNDIPSDSGSFSGNVVLEKTHFNLVDFSCNADTNSSGGASVEQSVVTTQEPIQNDEDSQHLLVEGRAPLEDLRRSTTSTVRSCLSEELKIQSSNCNLIRNESEEDSKSQMKEDTSNMNRQDFVMSAEDSQVNKFEATNTWLCNADWNQDEKTLKDVVQENIPESKPPRSFTMKNVDDYCKSIGDMEDRLQGEASGWTFLESGSVSWQPIDKNQEEFYKKSVSSARTMNNFQRSKFHELEVADKETNTHHADFLVLSNDFSNHSLEGLTVLQAYDRDINFGKSVSGTRISLKPTFDKGTYTEDDFLSDLKVESKQDKVRELSRLFPNRSPASLKELLKQCNGDVNYVSNLLLDDTDNDTFVAPTSGEAIYDSDSDLEPANLEETVEIGSGSLIPTVEPPLAPSDNASVVYPLEEAEEVKRHIEQSIDFSQESYSPHLRTIKNLRRGIREGAIPKMSSPVSEEPISSTRETTEVSADTLQEPFERESGGSSGDDEYDFSEELELVLGPDFVQQLVDKFGVPSNLADVSPVVKFPVRLARQIYDIIFSPSDQEEEDYDDGNLAIKLQCEEDEKIARRLYEEMQHKGESSDHSFPNLREIMDMELAQSIYKADVDSLSRNSQETMASVLAKRLLEDNYKQVDKKVLHDIFASCNYSFEDTVKTLQEALTNDGQVFSENGRAQREEMLLERAKAASLQESYEAAEENPWNLSDPMAYHGDLRQKAEEFLRERDEMYRKANDAFRRKERSVAAYYSRLGHLNNQKYQHARALAVGALAAAQTNSHSMDTLDLHHFRVVEAVTVFDMFLDYHIRLLSERGSGHECLKIITGRGTHSVDGKPVIKPAILSRIKKRGLRFDLLSNPGVVRVWVKGSSPLSQAITDKTFIH